MTSTAETADHVKQNFGPKQNITVHQIQRLYDLYDEMRQMSDGSGMANAEMMVKYYEQYYEQDQFKRFLELQGRDFSYVVYTLDDHDSGLQYWRKVKEFEEIFDAIGRAKLILEEDPDVILAFGLIEHIEYRPPRPKNV